MYAKIIIANLFLFLVFAASITLVVTAWRSKTIDKKKKKRKKRKREVKT